MLTSHAMKMVIHPSLTVLIVCLFAVRAEAYNCSYMDVAGNIHYADIHDPIERRRMGCEGDGGRSYIESRRSYLEWREQCCKNKKGKRCNVKKECKLPKAKAKKRKNKGSRKRRR